MNNDKLFRQALQRQNDRAANMKMPDDMEQRVMRNLKPKAIKRRWLYPLSTIAVTASVLLLIMLNTGKHEPEQQTPVVAKEVTVPKDNMEETPQKIASTKATEQPVAAQTAKPQPAKKRKKAHKPALEEPVPQEAEPVQEEQENEYLPQQPDPFLLAAAETQKIRSRGERLFQEVNEIINNAKNTEQ